MGVQRMGKNGRRCWLVLAACLATSGMLAGETKRTARGQKPLSPAGEAVLAAHLKDAFDAGRVIGPQHLQEALKDLELARQVAQGEPRVDYTHGLVLVKQLHVAAAIAQFEAARKLDGGRYWPAWQAAIWGHCLDKQYETGLVRLTEYARIVQAAEKSDEVSEAQRHAARWIGQLFEALSLCADSKKLHDLIANHEDQLLDAFGDELSEEVEAGRESIREREFALEVAAGTARQAADREQKRRTQERTSKLEKDIERAGKARDDDKKSAEEWKQWLDETLAKTGKQLGLLERDYAFLERRAQSLMQSITLAGQEITALSVQPRQVIFPQDVARYYSDIQQRQNQMFGYQLEYNATIGRLQAVAQQGNFVSGQRAEAILRYQTATGQLVQKDSDLDKWAKRLKNEKQKLTVQKPPAKGNKKAPAAQKHEFSLKSYVPLDFDVEKRHVLASFSPPAESKRD
ncbi:MAG: hypothetical protein ACM3U2_16645 [Deltaproteobacteria bacterium]